MRLRLLWSISASFRTSKARSDGKGATELLFRELAIDELDAIWRIDRGEYIESIYRCSSGALSEETINLQLPGWPPRDREVYAPILRECCEHGGYFCGAFDQGRLVAVVVLGDRFLGGAQDQLQLKLMYVDRAYRKTGLGRRLFEAAVEEARRRGARRLYISSCETKNTVDFYRHLGCKMTSEVDPELLALEPMDIHMEFEIPPLPHEGCSALDESALSVVERYFSSHPVLSRYLTQVAVCLTGSYAFGLGGQGADVDLKVIAPRTVFERIRDELIASGRIAPCGAPEEELVSVVGDYVLEPVEGIRDLVSDYRDLTQVFIYGHLVPLLGNSGLTSELIVHCRRIPDEVLRQERRREEDLLSDVTYAFLRSFQTGDEVGRLLARATIIRSSTRLAFLAEGEAPPYDKHLYRMLPRIKRGAQVEKAIRGFFEESQGPEDERYSAVAQAADWHEMYRAAEGTPVMDLLAGIRSLVGTT